MTAFLAGGLDPRELAAVEAHLASCADCREVLGDAWYGGAQSPAGVCDPCPAADADEPWSGVAWVQSSPDAPGSDMPRAGDLVAAKYRIEEALGRGGMGQVFAARHLELGHRVAMKVLFAKDPSSRSRFLREARTCARLVGDHVPRVFDIGELPGGNPYIVMELLTGEDLARRIARGPVGVSEAIDFLLQACSGVATVHAAGVIHRDIKPANLFVTAAGDGRPLLKVLDFGISKLVACDLAQAQDPSLTSTAAIVGSPPYMSPEQIRGHQDVDVRTDVWSLGAVLYELLTAHPPFRAATLPALSVEIATEPPRPPSSLRPEIPSDLESLVLRCLEKERGARFPSVDALRRQLEIVAAGGTGRLERFGARGAAAGTEPSRRPPLPAQMTPFVGRESELEQLTRLLGDPTIRLVTILAPGGMGKSRLAVEAAHALRERGVSVERSKAGAPSFPDGVYFIQLAPVMASDLLASTIAEAVGLRFRATGEPRQQLLEVLSEKRLLLVLDNFEHLLAGAPLIGDILESARGSKVLTTSRERLGLSGETRFELSGMTLPDSGAGYEALDFSAPKLFLQVAQQRSPRFELRPGDRPHLARICGQVRGLPLGILLAASWVDTLSLEEIAQEIAKSLDFLTTELHDVPERQRSLRVVFDSSWSRLSDEARRVFARICLFRGGFTREAAGAVADARPQTLADLMHLALVRRDPDNGRYEVHEVLRQYGELRLRESPADFDRTWDRFGDFYAEFLRARGEDLPAARQAAALDEIQCELANVRAAWTWMVCSVRLQNLTSSIESLNHFYMHRASFAEAELAFRSAVDVLEARGANGQAVARALGLALTANAAYVREGGRYPEAAILLERALAVLGDANHPRQRARVVVEYGVALLRAGRPNEAEVATQEGVALFRAAGDARDLVHGLDRLGSLYGGRCALPGNNAKAEAAYRESMDLQASTGDGAVLPSTQMELGYFLATRREQGADGCRLMLSARALMKESGDFSNRMTCELYLANVYRILGDYPLAESFCRGGLALAKEFGSWEIETESHFSLGDILKEQGRHDEAAAEYSAGRALGAKVGDVGRMASADLNFGDLALIRGQYGDARRQLRESLRGFESVGETWGVVLALDNLGYLGCLEGDWTTGQGYFCRALSAATAAQLTAFAMNIAAGMALFFVRTGRPERAVELLALAQSHPATERHTHARRIDPLLAELRTELSESTFCAAAERGRALGLMAVAAELRGGA